VFDGNFGAAETGAGVGAGTGAGVGVGAGANTGVGAGCDMVLLFCVDVVKLLFVVWISISVSESESLGSLGSSTGEDFDANVDVDVVIDDVDFIAGLGMDAIETVLGLFFKVVDFLIIGVNFKGVFAVDECCGSEGDPLRAMLLSLRKGAELLPVDMGLPLTFVWVTLA
jgi:hypothetical protein